MTARRRRAELVVSVRDGACGVGVLHRVKRLSQLTVVLVLSVAALVLPASAPAATTVTIGNGPELPDGSYINAQNVANNLVFTSVAIQADTSITIDNINLSTSIYGIPAFDLSLIAPTITIGADVNFGAYGNIFLTANTLNLNGKITSEGNVIFPSSDGNVINPARVFGLATNANVLSNAASIQQAIGISSRTAPVTVQVSAGQYDEHLTIAKRLTLKGNDGTPAAGADPTRRSSSGRRQAVKSSP